jgi:hypothetical protein
VSLWSNIRQRVKAVADALRNPGSYAPPPLPTTPPAATPREDRPVSRPPVTRVTRYTPRSELPESWGANKAALWSDATRTNSTLSHDPNAQRFYDAALYTFAEDHEQRRLNLDNFKDYIATRYGINWNDVFDWAEYRRNYDDRAGIAG